MLGQIKRFWPLFLAVAAVPLLVLFIFLFSTGRLFSYDGSRERRATTILSQEIIDLTGRTNKMIESVNLSDLRGDSTQARSLIEEARKNNGEAFQKAVILAKELENWTKAIPEMSSPTVQRSAYDLAAAESALIGEFISYTGDLNKFLNALSAAVVTDNYVDRAAIEQNLAAVNQRIAAINRISAEFARMSRGF
ncbi:MAG: hypothetical protein Q8L36_00405 [bacterium]|nr:hypothetical protein [bacterium]